jgi:cell division transport system permease protein
MMRGYLTHHAQALRGSLGRMARAPFATSLTVLVIALALALPLALGLFVSNAMNATGGFTGAVDVSVYFKPDVTLSRVQQLAQSARARPGVAAAQVISAEDGLKDFRQYSGFGAALQALGSNPLPHVLRLRPTPEAGAPTDLEALRRYLATWPEADVVQVDAEWVQRFNAILQLLRRVLGIAAALLGAGVLAIVGNTIRLEIQGRRPEIEVVRLVGGSTGFVRRPFLYTGALYGLGGALLAWVLVAAAVQVLRAPVATLAGLYASRFALGGPDPTQLGVLFGAGLGLGWLGAWLAAARHLRGIEPRA